MINYTTGNLFDSPAQALVNTVNCVGVMGKGIAHQFAKRYPAMVQTYKEQCKKKEIQPGQMTTHKETGKIIVNFPTKNHWRAKSRLPDIETGLVALKKLIVAESIQSIAMPPLGCGNGGLAWNDVQPLIERYLGDLEDVEITVFEPRGSFKGRGKKVVKLHLSHYILIALRQQLEDPKTIHLAHGAYFLNALTKTLHFPFQYTAKNLIHLEIAPFATQIKLAVQNNGLELKELIPDALEQGLKGKDADKLQKLLPQISGLASWMNENTADLDLMAKIHAILSFSGPQNTAALQEALSIYFSEPPEEAELAPLLDRLEGFGLVTRTLQGWAAEGLRANSPNTDSLDTKLPLKTILELRGFAKNKGITQAHALEEAIQLLVARDNRSRLRQ